MLESDLNTSKKRSLSLHGYTINIDGADRVDELTCAFLGPRGTYTEQAVLELLGEQVGIVPLSTITEVIRSTERGDTDIGFVPIENSIEGNVLESVRGVIHSELSDNSGIRILGEKVLPINHFLFGTKEGFAKKILRSHPQALAQCSRWISENLPDAIVVRETSTAEAVKVSVERNELAIGNKLAGELYGAKILAESITDLASNHTRFWLLGRGKTFSTGNDRVTLVFTLKNMTGALIGALRPFSERGISINKVDTLPLGTLDEYYFLMSVDGHQTDPNIIEAIDELKSRVWKAKVLGSYRKSLTNIIYDPEAIAHGWIDFRTL